MRGLNSHKHHVFREGLTALNLQRGGEARPASGGMLFWAVALVRTMRLLKSPMRRFPVWEDMVKQITDLWN